MSDTILIKKLEENMELFKKMYDMIRFVDPIKKTVVQYSGCNRSDTNSICHSFWEKGKICDNCISIRAYLNNKCYFKLEQSQDVIMLVTALPISDANESTVLELLKNTTDSMILEEGQCSDGHLFKSVFNEINEMIVKDELTGLYNRRYVDERLPADIVKSVLEKKPLSLVFLDIDNLKEINDTYGHICGDKMINGAASKIASCILNETDWAARYGGDKFVICMNNTESKTAYEIAEKIRCKIADLEIPMNNMSIRTTASFGIHTMRDEHLTAEEIISLADRRMDEAKQKGKNTSVGFSIDHEA